MLNILFALAAIPFAIIGLILVLALLRILVPMLVLLSLMCACVGAGVWAYNKAPKATKHAVVEHCTLTDSEYDAITESGDNQHPRIMEWRLCYEMNGGPLSTHQSTKNLSRVVHK